MNHNVALISGGTSGIGLATAKKLLSQGWNVVISGRSRERGEQALQYLGEIGRTAYVCGDVSRDEDCARMAAATIRRFGRLDGLVTAAGYYEEKLLEQVTPVDIQHMFAVNVYGTMYLCQHCLPYLKSSGGAVVTVSSDAGLQGNIACSVYGATKGAVIAFTKSLALEMAPHDVRVNVVCPGDVKTPLLDRQMAADQTVTEESIKQNYPLYRICTAAEVANAIAFLLSKDASYLTAVALPVDGGLTSW
ncbi:MAG: SDR family oxidoreductase [Megasphaera sp.]|jgi:NAD(P)-dependent dehydrogenase (short-subunit alcohol dehydrogenase family)|nr:SDR family oxidoreductase [Megasphaera sp.]MCI1247468.1 SDR family oxidoreductase [Megasphaera sp.]